MNRKLILKFDTKEVDNKLLLRCDLYKVESIKIAPKKRCVVQVPNNLSKGRIHHLIDELIMQLDYAYDIGFKKNNIKNIRAWIHSNIFKIYIRKNMIDDIDDGILKIISDKCIIIRD